MKLYSVDKVITLQAGVITLTDAQAAARQHCLKRLMGKGRYEIQKPVQFKRGEVIGLEGISIKQYDGWLIPIKPDKADK